MDQQKLKIVSSIHNFQHLFCMHCNTFPHTTWTHLYSRNNTHICPLHNSTREGSVPEHTTVYHPVIWCLSEAWRNISKLLVEVKGKSIAAGAAYSGVTFKKRARAVLSSSKEVVLFQCMSHLALMLYLWLRGWALALAQAAVQPIDSQRESNRGKKKEIKQRKRGGKGGLESVLVSVLVSDRHTESERRGEGCWGKRREGFLLLFFFWVQFKIPRRERSLLWRGDCSEPHWHPACLLVCVCVYVCFCVCFPQREGLMESVGYWLESKRLSQQTACALTVVHASNKHIHMQQTHTCCKLTHLTPVADHLQRVGRLSPLWNTMLTSDLM